MNFRVPHPFNVPVKGAGYSSDKGVTVEVDDLVLGIDALAGARVQPILKSNQVQSRGSTFIILAVRVLTIHSVKRLVVGS